MSLCGDELLIIVPLALLGREGICFDKRVFCKVKNVRALCLFAVALTAGRPAWLIHSRRSQVAGCDDQLPFADFTNLQIYHKRPNSSGSFLQRMIRTVPLLCKLLLAGGISFGAWKYIDMDAIFSAVAFAVL